MILVIPSLTNLIVRVSKSLRALSDLPFFTYFVHNLLAVASLGLLGIMLLYLMKYHPHDFDVDLLEYVEQLPQQQAAPAEVAVRNDDFSYGSDDGDDDGAFIEDDVSSIHCAHEICKLNMTSGCFINDDDDNGVNSNPAGIEYECQDSERDDGSNDCDGDGDVSVKALCGHHICKLKRSPYCFVYTQRTPVKGTIIFPDDDGCDTVKQ
jgi:hypothetical protein